MTRLSELIGGSEGLWESGAQYQPGERAISPTDFCLYICKTPTSGEVDPAVAVDWQPFGARPIKSIQRGVTGISPQNATAMAIISEVDPAKTEVRVLGQTTVTGYHPTGYSHSLYLGGPTVRVVLTSGTELTLYGSNSNAQVSWEVTEYY